MKVDKSKGIIENIKSNISYTCVVWLSSTSIWTSCSRFMRSSLKQEIHLMIFNVYQNLTSRFPSLYLSILCMKHILRQQRNVPCYKVEYLEPIMALIVHSRWPFMMKHSKPIQCLPKVDQTPWILNNSTVGHSSTS